MKMMKSYFPKVTRKMVNFKSYSKFGNSKFKNQLAAEMDIIKVTEINYDIHLLIL